MPRSMSELKRKEVLEGGDRGPIAPAPSLELPPPTPYGFLLTGQVWAKGPALPGPVKRVGRGAWGEGRESRSLALPPTGPPPITIIGGGLAGSEAAWQAARRGVRVRLYEMKPVKFSPAHQSPFLGELVCSNSLRAEGVESAVGLLKEEMRRLDSLIMAAAAATRVPAGKALAVDRGEFAAFITRALEAEPLVEIIREEIAAPDPEQTTVIATGPLTSEPLAEAIGRLTGQAHLHFYDAIAPIVAADSLDMGRVFRASRYGAGDDYLNCPFSEAEYNAFYEALMAAEQVPLRAFEEPRYFEGCLPVEIMAARGFRTLLFGPMKPVGLVDPRTGRQPFAVVQLRAENREGTPLQPGGLSDQAEVRGAGTGLPADPGAGASGVCAPGLHPPQHLYPAPGYFVGLPQFPPLSPDLSGGTGLRGGGLRRVRGHGAPGRDQRRPPGCVPPPDYPAPGDRAGGPHRAPHQHRYEEFSAHERQLRAVFAA